MEKSVLIIFVNNLSGYVDCETDYQVIFHAALLCGYLVDETEHIDFRNIVVNRERCNLIYSKELAERIEKLVDSFFDRSLYEMEKHIIKMKYVYVN